MIQTNTMPNKGNRTNTKEVKAAIQKYITDAVYTDEFPEHDGTFKKSLEIICSEFQRVAIYPYNLKMFKTYQSCFIDWLQGLPSCINISVYNNEIIELMASFGLPLPSNKTQSEGIELFYNLIYREFSVICKKNNVSVY